MSAQHPISADPEVIVFNLKKRYTGVSATVNALVPLQLKQWAMAYCGTPLSNGVHGMTLRQAIRLSKRPPAGRAFRIWHVRRDHEMVAGLWARDVLRLPIKLVFTSAAKRQHGRFPRWLISRMDAVVATSPDAARFVPNTTAVVPHGVDLSRFTAPINKLQAWADSGLPGHYGIGVFGRVRPEKGTDVFVQAMIQALPQLPNVTAIVVGLAAPEHQDFQRELQQAVERAGLSDRVIWVGEVGAADIPHWYQRCLLCVACPRYEAFGLTPFEAAASACAVVCSKTGAFDQLVVPGQNGELVDTGDADGLAQAVVKVMQDPQGAQTMGLSALQRVGEHFNLEQEAAGIGRVYHQLFNRA